MAGATRRALLLALAGSLFAGCESGSVSIGSQDRDVVVDVGRDAMVDAGGDVMLDAGGDVMVDAGGDVMVDAGGGTEWTGPYPVVIAAGAFAPAFTYEPMAARLAEYGYSVEIYTIPTPLRSIEYTAPTLAAFVEDVLARTGAPKVSIVSHSQGGLLSRYFIRYLGGLEKVDTLVSLSGLHYGSSLATIPPLLGVTNCLDVEICQELLTGSDLLNSLNEPLDVDGDIHYVNITSMFEEAAIPYTNNFHRDVTAGDVTNFYVQEHCPFRFVEHLTLATDGTTAHAITDALARKPIDIRDDCFGW